MPGIDFGAVEQRCPLLDVLKLLHWRPSSTYGDDERGWCPIHSKGQHRSRIFSACRGLWYCSRCKRGGTALKLWQIVRGETVYDAARSLCAALLVEVPYLPREIRAGIRPPRNRIEER